MMKPSDPPKSCFMAVKFTYSCCNTMSDMRPAKILLILDKLPTVSIHSNGDHSGWLLQAAFSSLPTKIPLLHIFYSQLFFCDPTGYWKQCFFVSSQTSFHCCFQPWSCQKWRLRSSSFCKTILHSPQPRACTKTLEWASTLKHTLRSLTSTWAVSLGEYKNRTSFSHQNPDTFAGSLSSCFSSKSLCLSPENNGKGLGQHLRTVLFHLQNQNCCQAIGSLGHNWASKLFCRIRWKLSISCWGTSQSIVQTKQDLAFLIPR